MYQSKNFINQTEFETKSKMLNLNGCHKLEWNSYDFSDCERWVQRSLEIPHELCAQQVSIPSFLFKISQIKSLLESQQRIQTGLYSISKGAPIWSCIAIVKIEWV